MRTYRIQVVCEAPRGWARDDLLAHVVGNVSAVTIVERATVLGIGGGHQRVSVTFLGLNDQEALETARRARSGLPVAADVLLDRRDGRAYARVRDGACI